MNESNRNESSETKNTDRREDVSDLSVWSIFLLDDLFSHSFRHTILLILQSILYFSIAVLFFFTVLLSLGFFPLSFSDPLSVVLFSKFIGFFFVFLSLWFMVFELELFHRSIYFHNRENRTPKVGEKRRVVSEVAELFYRATDDDILRSFFASPVGTEAAARLGIASSLDDFLKGRQEKRIVSFSDIEQAGVVRREELVGYLFDINDEFSAFLFQNNISKTDLLRGVAWAVKKDLLIKYNERWWSRSRLKKFPSIGKEWAYGGAHILKRYGQPISGELGDENSFDFIHRRKKHVEQLEAILSKNMEANALLVGDQGVGQEEVVRDLARRLVTGVVPKPLVANRLIRLKTDLLLSFSRSKSSFEREFMRVLADANRAGNIILVIDDFAGFVRSAEGIGSDALHFLENHMQNMEMKIIGLVDAQSYHQKLEVNPLVVNRFTPIKIQEPSDDALLGILEDNIPSIEYHYQVFVTYQGLDQVVQSAKYHLTEGVMPDKAIDLLTEVASRVLQSGGAIIDREAVKKYVSEKTNIPLGGIESAEREKLENLEEEIHKFVVGQDRAVSAISNSLRRTRAGIRDMERPIGSFLFLGPTGVGKTQTAKALAQVYFGDKETMARIDMSEYQDPGALERLIGSFVLGKMGTLTSIMKAHPYGLLLLDEFEKSHSDVHDLFLQIFDEGFFSDMNGKKVNARNLIIIATSNAGSDMIWQASKRGEDTSQMKEMLTNYVIEHNIYRPELLNRFDDTLVFHPLSDEHLYEVAKIMLFSTKERLYQKGYELEINELLIRFVVEKGYDPIFGARPMRNAIEETIEQVISKKIIGGSLNIGDRIELSENDLQ